MFERIKDYISEYLEDCIDAALDITLVILSTLTLLGCSVTPDSTYHPAWPVPYQACDVTWYVLEKDSSPYIAISYDDSLRLAECNYDMLRYIREINAKFCQYRPEGDTRCGKSEE